MITDIVLLAQHFEAMQECILNLRLSTTEHPYHLIVVLEEDSLRMSQWLEQNRNVTVVFCKPGTSVAAAYNIGVAAASSPHIVCMREYMYVTDGWLGRLNDCMERHKLAAVVGPVSSGISGLQNTPIISENPRVMQSYSESIGIMRESRSKRVTRVLSHLVMLRKSAFNQLGGFDERFEEESYEDDDLCYRALQEGYELYVAEDCFVRYERKYGKYADDPSLYDEQISTNSRKSFEKWGLDISLALHSWKWAVTVSLCMIVKNEEETLERCLSSVQGSVDEIIIIDTGSTDRTKEIARQFTHRVYDFEWMDDFSAARNFAFQKAEKDYILWLDADDILLPRDADKFLALKQSLPWQTDAVSMVYNLAFDEFGHVTVSLRRNRLVKRERGFRWIGVVHEYLEVIGAIEYADVCVTHDRKHTQTSRNLNLYEKKEKEGKKFSSRDLYYYANELFDHQQWARSLRKYELFLEQKDGWIEDIINACGRAADCLHNLGNPMEAKAKALLSFAYQLPRAENCCRLGYYHMEESDYASAVYWYQMAASLEKPQHPQALLQHTCWTWLPHIQLSVCYNKLGQNERANHHNEIAATFIPEDSRILSNRAYFQGLGIGASSSTT
ncbi:glycosyltransferase [Paenibacillus sp. LjRoot56]|uniref:glycosyltransferase n=1 Tax=Paenibacillus sp. LjRoot56 TaxID=3342333 RepID=UPI003ECCCC24